VGKLLNEGDRVQVLMRRKKIPAAKTITGNVMPPPPYFVTSL